MEMEFKSVSELYQRVLPALRTKKHELHKNGYTYLKEEDIWNYLKETKWSKSVDLFLADMVEDILNTKNQEFDLYFKEKLKDKERVKYFTDLEII